MDIQNLKPIDQPLAPTTTTSHRTIYYLMTIILAVFVGFWSSRFFPTSTTLSPDIADQPISADNLSSQQDIAVGQTYGNLNGTFKDSATGYIRKGNINGIGTHILERPGGLSQRASLTSSVLDLDLFVDRRVDIKGETNTSDKSSWLLDVGSITVLE